MSELILLSQLKREEQVHVLLIQQWKDAHKKTEEEFSKMRKKERQSAGQNRGCKAREEKKENDWVLLNKAARKRM